ncbi:MAG TPA: LUD domain-containing protein [Peptococcaceae bacterium]|nr:LUD domain-containing protein [Peptococcaceae bacterium]
MANTQLKKEISEALQNNVLRGALERFSRLYVIAREKAYEGYDFEDLRNNIQRVKSYAADHIDEMIDLFEKNAKARGAKVFRAANGKEANDYVRRIAKENNVKKVVKSKSMASEEILMNEALREDGLEVQETDLGEFIIAIEGKHPSHMVFPAIHLTKEQVADLFTGYTKKKNDPVISKLVKTARSVMRKKFLEADMGISGANIAVAETGTLFTFTNEGNARLTSTIPRVHVYIVGIEKIVPKFKDATYIMKALPRNGTAQNITTYVSLYTGATEAYLEDGTKGEKEFHIVILDNGRRKILQDEKFRQIFNCIRCGGCINVCPAFQLVGGHVYGGHAYTGGIGTILTAFLTSEETANQVQNLCLQCGSCTEVCAGKLNIPEMILELRNRHGAKTGLPFTQKFALDVVSNRRLFHSLLRIASVAQKPFTKGQPVIRHLPMFLSGLTEGRSLPAIAKTPFRDIFPTIKQDVPNPKGTVAFYAGCLVDFVYPRIGEGVVSALNEVGYKVVFPEKQSCCGAPASYMGDKENAVKSAILNIEALEAEKVDYIVSACPTCTHGLLDYQKLLEDKPEMLKRAKVLAEKLYDFPKLITMLGGLKDKGDGIPLKVTYHDSCHLRRTMGVYKEQRALLAGTSGIELIEMKESDRCCGFAGSYSIKFPEISVPILQRKIQNILETGAEVVALDCPGCLMQITGGLDQINSKIKVKHTAELLLDKRKK